LSIKMPMLGKGNFATWSGGPAAVNLATGNLVLSLPGPSYPSATTAMAAAVTYNSLDTANTGLGQGLRLEVGDMRGGLPSRLVDLNLSSANPQDALQVVMSDGDSDYYTASGKPSTYQPDDGHGAATITKSASGYTLAEADGDIFTFGTAAAGTGYASLVSIQDASGDPGSGQLTYTFDASVSPPRVTQIRDGAGRQLGLSRS